MGFGILLFGYFITFAFTLSRVYFFADIVGAVIMMYSFVKLSEYNLLYRHATMTCFVFLAACSVRAAAMFNGWFGQGSTASLAVSVIMLAAACAVHVLMFLGARGISFGADDVKLVRKCERQLGMSVVYYLCAAVILIFGESLGTAANYLNAAMTVYWLLWFILNLTTVYSCFGRLYPADEDQSTPKRSRFAFINKINDKFDSFDEKSNEFRIQSIKMANEEADRRALEKNKKSKKKKKKKK